MPKTRVFFEQKTEAENQNRSAITDSNVPNVNYNSPSTLNEFSFISEDIYNSVLQEDLEVEAEETTTKPKIIEGYRIVDLEYVLNWSMSFQLQHSKICTGGKIYLQKEERHGMGLDTCLIFGCTVCSEVIRQYSCAPDEKSNLNYGFVWGTLSTGSTYGHSQELLAVMDIPPMSKYTFKTIEQELGHVWKDSLSIEIEKAGIQEKRIAMDKGHIDKDGVPYIDVYVDGGWSKRSYGHSYVANSGVAVIVGRETKKILFVGVRNKYCCICTRAANKQSTPGPHICFKNWGGSSSAMEADIIVEGFSKSEEMHQLRYKNFIADGDSSVYRKIIERVPYGTSVNKIECVNHVIKNYGKGLRKLKLEKTCAL